MGNCQGGIKNFNMKKILVILILNFLVFPGFCQEIELNKLRLLTKKD